MPGPSIRLHLRVSPGAGRSAVVGRYGSGWKIRIARAPERGKANAALLDLLAKTLAIPRESVALVGGRVVTAVLGNAFSGHVGDQLGRLVVFLSPWMVANAAFLITYPLLFVMHRTRLLIPLAIAAVAVDIPISIAGRALWGLTGVTVALGVSTLVVVLGLMASLAPRMLVLTVVGLGRLSILVGAATALAFGGASLVLGAVPAAAAGLALYAVLLVAMRQLGLAQAWHYVRALH